MTTILQPVTIDKKFEYEVEKQGQLYIAGIQKVKLNNQAEPFGNVYLDELNRTKEKEYTPFLTQPVFPRPDYNPWYSYVKEKRKNIFSIKKITIAESLDQFVENIRMGLIKQLTQKMQPEDIVYFFDKVHQHYRNVY